MGGTRVDLSPFVPRLVLEWQKYAPDRTWQEIEGTLVFADISGFTALTERLSRAGKVGAEELTDIINATFDVLLEVAYEVGGGLLKFGGDALLLWFDQQDHAGAAAHAAWGMQKALRSVSRVKSSAGTVRLGMSVGMHTDVFQFFLAGESYRELVVTGPAATKCTRMESAAEKGDILLSAQTASRLDPALLGNRKGPGRLLRRRPPVPAAAAKAPPRVSSKRAVEFVPPAIARFVGGGGADAEHRVATGAFVRASGIDDAVDSVGAEKAARLVDDLVSLVDRVCEEHDIALLCSDIYPKGTKFQLTAGAPESFEGNEERMLRAMRALVEADSPFPLGIGVHRGYVFGGLVGPPYRRTYTAMGDIVNLAARLMARSKPGQVVAMPEVLERSRTLFSTTRMRPFAAKGKSEPVQALKVGPITGTRVSAASALPLVGREAELEVLRSALSSAADGRGSMVVVSGEAGLGKSRLVAELRDGASGCRVLPVTCDRYRSASAYASIRPLIWDALGGTGTLRARVRKVAPELLPWLPLLGVVLGVDVPETTETKQLDERFRRTRLHETVTTLLEALLPGPTLLLVEDAHWIDEASGALLKHLVKGMDGRPWLVCVTARPGYEAPKGVRSLGLEPLDAEASARLARAAAEQLLLPHQAEALAARSGGNPFFLQELAQSFGGASDVETLPESVDTAITTRIDALSSGDRTVLRYAAVLGRTVELGLLAESLGPEAPGDEAVWKRLGTFIARDGEGTLQFRHDLLRETAYAGLPYRRRRAIHRRVGEVIEAKSGEDAADLLSLHFYEAGDWDRAWRYSKLAGDRALASFANIDAMRILSRALSAARIGARVSRESHAVTWEAYAQASKRAGQLEGRDKALGRARRLVADPVHAARLLHLEGQAREGLGKYGEALTRYRKGLRLLTAFNTPDSAKWRNRLLLGCSHVYFRRGEFRRAIVLAEEAATLARTSEDRPGLAHAHARLFLAHLQLGSPEMDVYKDLPLTVFEEIGDLVALTGLLTAIATAEQRRGNLRAAAQLHERSREVSQMTGDARTEALIANNLGEVLLDQGRLTEAENLFGNAFEAATAAGYRLVSAAAQDNLGVVAMRRGKLDEAKRLISDAVEAYRALGARDLVLLGRAHLAECLILQDDISAPGELGAVLRDAEVIEGADQVWISGQRLRALAHARKLEINEAIRALNESLQRARQIGSPFEAARTSAVWLSLRHLLGIDPPQTEDELDAAFDMHGVVDKAAILPQPPWLRT